MACLMKLKNGCWKIQFVGGDRRRKALYPGAMPRKAAETITTHVEALLAAVLSNSAPESHTATWLGSIAPKLRRSSSESGSPASGSMKSPRPRSARPSGRSSTTTSVSDET